jgi:acyl-CoA-binding protein
MRLYGLYKQAMEGDVDGVMERPSSAAAAAQSPSGLLLTPEDLRREQDKWDAWNSQRGLSRTEAKRRYIEALIETIHRFATTPSAVELVSELEFVWNQIKGNSASSGSHSSGGSGDSPSAPPATGRGSRVLRGPRPMGEGVVGAEGERPLKVISPMSEEDRESVRRVGDGGDEDEEDEEDEDGQGGEYVKRGDKWSKKMERAIVRLSAEIAALREQITSGREWRLRRERSVSAWVGWVFWVVVKHLAVDSLILALVLIWLRRKKDRRLEDHVRGALRLVREYVRKVLPAR